MCLAKGFDLYPVGNEKPTEVVQPANCNSKLAEVTHAVGCIKYGEDGRRSDRRH